MIRLLRPGRHRSGAVPDAAATTRVRPAMPHDRSSLLPDPARSDWQTIGIDRILPAHLLMLR